MSESESELFAISIFGLYGMPPGIIALISGILLAGIGGYNGYASLLAIGILLALSPAMIGPLFLVGWLGNERKARIVISSAICVSLTTIVLSFLYVYYK
jgi:hypothetical protein